MARIIIGTLLVLWGMSALLGFSLFRFFFAFAIILLGVHILSGRRNWADRENKDAASVSQDDYVNEVVILGALKKKVVSGDFKGGKVTMVFAGGELDLSGAKTAAKEIDLHVESVFAGIKLIVPRAWKVSVRGTSFAGGYDSKVADASGDVTLNLRGSAVFGGVEITN
jgi:predicted membrane protein